MMDELAEEQGNSNVYDFFEPQSIQRAGNKREEVQRYIQNWIMASKREIYLGAYLFQ